MSNLTNLENQLGVRQGSGTIKLSGSNKGSIIQFGLQAQATIKSQASLKSKIESQKNANLNKSGISGITGMSIMKDVLAE